MSQFKVSVMIITYNHDRYLGRAISSVAEQVTNFPYEINIIEDCSTDDTQNVARRYKSLYPDKINLYFNEKNIGSKVTQRNFIRGFKTLKGEYLAILEGDDYWSDENKLQKQVDFLDANPKFSAVTHNAIKFYEDQKTTSHKFLYYGEKSEHKLEDIIYLYSMFHTTTLLYRNVYKGEPPKQFINPFSCDIFILIAHAQFGPVKYFDDDMAMYRSHSGGVFSGMTPLEGWLFNIDGLRRYNRWLGFRHNKHFCFAIYKYCSYVLDQWRQSKVVLPLVVRIKLSYLALIYYCFSYIYYLFGPLESPLGSMVFKKFHYDRYDQIQKPVNPVLKVLDTERQITW